MTKGHVSLYRIVEQQTPIEGGIDVLFPADTTTFMIDSERVMSLPQGQYRVQGTVKVGHTPMSVDFTFYVRKDAP